MTETIGYADIVRMLEGAVQRVRQSSETLSKLDSFGGDGDHGTTMARAMGHLEQAMAEAAPGNVAGLFHDIGWAIMGVDGGATGPLFGALFMGMAETAPSASEGGEQRLDAHALAAVFEAGLAAVRTNTRAQLGDKTLLDALVPAVEALRAAAEAGAGPREAVARAATAAAEGAEATKQYQARFGRAKNIREKSIGEQDPGATSVSLIVQGMAENV